jgi:hypothetical protein
MLVIITLLLRLYRNYYYQNWMIIGEIINLSRFGGIILKKRMKYEECQK